MTHRTLERSGRSLLKQALWAARFYPVPGYDAVKKKIREEVAATRELRDPEQIKQAIARGRWHLRELEALNRLHKYRGMKKRYYDEQEKTDEEQLKDRV
jgi:hypothetical protein